jgi:hypothetical protein
MPRTLTLKLTHALALALLAGAGCATFDDITPKGAWTDINKGIWVAKSSSFLGVRFASQEVLFCFAEPKSKPMCYRAGGDVEAASVKETANKTEQQQK